MRIYLSSYLVKYRAKIVVLRTKDFTIIIPDKLVRAHTDTVSVSIHI